MEPLHPRISHASRTSETRGHSAHVDPVRAHACKRLQFPSDEDRSVDHDVVQMLTGDLLMVRDQHVPLIETIDAIAINSITYHDAQIRHKVRNSADVL